jgi:hypothetical protein
MKACLLVLAWLLLSSWPAAAQSAPGSQARLVVYRQREFGGNPYTIKLNEKAWSELPTNRYLQIDLPPGRVKIETATDYFTESQTLWLTLRAGRTYYVKAVEDVDFMTRTLLLALLSDEQGQRETQGLKPATVRLLK